MVPMLTCSANFNRLSSATDVPISRLRLQSEFLQPLERKGSSAGSTYDLMTMDMYGVVKLLCLTTLSTVTMGETPFLCGNMKCKYGIKYEGSNCKCCLDCSKFNRQKSTTTCPLTKSDCGNCLCGYKEKMSFSGFLDTCVKDANVAASECSVKSPEGFEFPQHHTITIVMLLILLPVIFGGARYWYKRGQCHRIYEAMRKTLKSPTTSTPDISDETGSDDPLLNTRQPSENEAEACVVAVEPATTSTPHPEEIEQLKQISCTTDSVTNLPVSRKEDVRLCTAIPTEGYWENPAATLNGLTPTAPPISDTDISQEQVVPSLLEDVTVTQTDTVTIDNCDSGHNTMLSIESCSSHESMESIGNASTVPMESPPQSLGSEGSDSEQQQHYAQYGHTEQKVPVESDEHDEFCGFVFEFEAHLQMNR